MFLYFRFPGILRATALSALFVFAATSFSFSGNPKVLTWTKLKPTKGFPARAAFASAYDPVSKKVVVFGGVNVNNFLGDTWTFDGTTWAKVQTTNGPGPRAGAAMAYDSATQKLVMFGGFVGFTLLDETWVFDGATSTWKQVHSYPDPKAATNPMLFTDPLNGHVDMFGGYQGRFFSRSMWQWNGTDWVQLNPTTAP